MNILSFLGDELATPWTYIWVSFYIFSIVLVGSFFLKNGKSPRVLRALAGRVNGAVGRMGLVHILSLSMIFFILFSAVHYVGYTDVAAAGDDALLVSREYRDTHKYGLPAANLFLNGGNPWSDLSELSGMPPLERAFKQGILEVALHSVGASFGGFLGIVLLWTFIICLIPSVTYLVARNHFSSKNSPSKEKANYYAALCALLVLFLPIMTFLNVRSQQDDPFIALAILVPILLLQKERFLEASMAAGLMAHVKFVSLFIFLALVIMLYRVAARKLAENGDGEGLGLFLKHVKYFAVAIVTFGVIFGATYLRYGDVYLSQVYMTMGLLDGFKVVSVFWLPFDITVTSILWSVAGIGAILATFLFFFIFSRESDYFAGAVLVLSVIFLTIPIITMWYFSWIIPFLVIYLVSSWEGGGAFRGFGCLSTSCKPGENTVGACPGLRAGNLVLSPLFLIVLSLLVNAWSIGFYTLDSSLLAGFASVLLILAFLALILSTAGSIGQLGKLRTKN